MLLSDQWGNIGPVPVSRSHAPMIDYLLEAADTDTEDNEAGGKADDSNIGVLNDRGKSRYDEDNVSKHSKDKRDLDCLQTTPELVGNPCPEDWGKVAPESID